MPRPGEGRANLRNSGWSEKNHNQQRPLKEEDSADKKNGEAKFLWDEGYLLQCRKVRDKKKVLKKRFE